jgi:hypothetical protein
MVTMHSFLVGAIYVAMVIAPCVIALVTRAEKPDNSTESDVLRDGFI